LKGKTGIIAACALLAAAAIWMAVGRALAADMVYPAENFFSRAVRSVCLRTRAFSSRAKLVAENDRLKAENAALGMVRSDADAVAAENVRLRKLLGFAERTPGKWIAAPVLSRGGAAGVRHVLRLGRGSRDGVKPYATVAVPDGLVGRVEEVSAAACTVRLITDPEMRVACEVETGDDAFGSVFGIVAGGGARALSPDSEGTVIYSVSPLMLRHIKRDLALPPRAKLVTSGLGGTYPRGLSVGFLIDSTREDETKLEREGEVVPAVDFPSLEDVFIRRES